MRWVILVLTLLATPAAATETYVAHLNGADAGTPSPGTGLATLILSDDATTIDIYMSLSGLLGTEAGAHVHRLDGGGVAFDIGVGNPIYRQWMFVLPTDVQRLRNQQLWINIHTSLYPAGEIRGTVMPQQATPVDPSTWGKIKALYRD